MTKPDFIAYNHEHSNNLSLMLCKKLYDTITIAYTIQSREDLKKALTNLIYLYSIVLHLKLNQ